VFKSSRGSAALAAIAIGAGVLVAALGLTAGAGHRRNVAHASTRAPAPAAPSVLDVTITPNSKLGPDGKRHDAYSQTEFGVQTGKPLTLRIDNTDDQPHSIVSQGAHVAIIASPGVHDYELLVKHAGRFRWRCFFSCDSEAGGWAMSHAGYMSGYITAA